MKRFSVVLGMLFASLLVLGGVPLAHATVAANAVARPVAAPALAVGGCDGGDGVYLYEHADYKGACLKFTGDESDLRVQGFNDRASSIRFVGDWTATLYRDVNYTGVSSTFVNNNSDLRNDAVGNDAVTSLRIKAGKTSGVERTCGEGDGVYLYADTDFRGRCIKLTADEPDLRTRDFNDRVSSIRILGDFTATLYRDLNGTGIASTFSSDDSDLTNDAVGNDQATSVRLARGGVPSTNLCGEGEGVYLYEHPQYQGRCVKLTGDAPDLRTLNFDDIASSIRVVGSWSVTLYRDLSGTGIASTFTQSDPNLADDAVGDNQVTSVAVRRVSGPAGACDGGEGMYLYEHPGYEGRCIKFTGDLPDLRLVNFDDIASSIRFVGSWTATLYRDLSGTGIASTFSQADANLIDNDVGDNQVTSVVVRRLGAPPGACDGDDGVYLYEHSDYQGRCVKFTNDLGDLRWVGFDDIASSIRFVGSWTATLYRDLTSTGIASTFITDDPNLTDNTIGDNQVTSIVVRRR